MSSNKATVCFLLILSCVVAASPLRADFADRNWISIGSGIDDVVFALAASDHDLYAVGPFLRTGGKISTFVARVAFVVPPSPPILLSPTLAGGSLTAWFTNAVGATFRGFCATNAGLPGAVWVPVGNVAEVSPGLYQFTDPQAAPAAPRYYRIQWP